MEKLVINGGKKLYGKTAVPVSKNAVLPIIAASFMLDGESSINCCPRLSDVRTSVKIVESLGGVALFEDDKLCIVYKDCETVKISTELCRAMRSSVLYLAPVLYRKGKVTICSPGGCNIGERPVDIHLAGLEKLGAKIETTDDEITVSAPQGLKGTQIKLRVPSVGATQTLIMAAATAKGLTVLKNCAREPEVVDLVRFLNLAGAKIAGAGRNEIIIQGVPSLTAVSYTPIPDRIIAATLLAAVNACKGVCIINNYPAEYMEQFEKLLKQTGLKTVHYSDSVMVYKYAHLKNNINVHTGFYPAFSTDMGPLLSGAMVNNKGELNICETVFENRFSYCKEFEKLGVECCVNDRCYYQQGYKQHSETQTLKAHDLRAGAAVVVAALAKQGCFEIDGVEFIDRGYENIEDIFSALGADIRRIQLD